MTGLEFLRAPGTTVEQIADIIAEHCPPVTPEYCDKLSCRECWLAWLATGEPPKEKGPSDKQTAPDEEGLHPNLAEQIRKQQIQEHKTETGRSLSRNSSCNQFYIFFKVVGKLFDQSKADLFRLREESSVLTCSDVMLPVHGQDRDMARLAGETLENYRVRLSMKGIIAEMAGINEGIFYLARKTVFCMRIFVPSYMKRAATGG